MGGVGEKRLFKDAKISTHQVIVDSADQCRHYWDRSCMRRSCCSEVASLLNKLPNPIAQLLDDCSKASEANGELPTATWRDDVVFALEV